MVSDHPWGLWTSHDGITWRPDDVDTSSSLAWSVPYVDGAYTLAWFINTDPLEMAISEGGAGQKVDLTGLVPPESDGFTWTLDVSKPLSRYTHKNEAAQAVFHVGFAGPDDQGDQRLLVTVLVTSRGGG